jgi:hypothetical protein
MILSATKAQNGFTWKSFKPDKSPARIKLSVMGKELNYYPLEKGQEILVTVEGPTRLKVLTRIEFGEEASGEKSYYLRYQRDGEKKYKFRRIATASPTAVLADSPAIHLGTSRSIYLKVPAGKHTYRFYVGSKAAYRLFLRFYERTTKVESKPENVAIEPVQFTSAVPLVLREDEVTYYRVGNQDSLKLSIIGPTTVKVLARLEFDPTMFAEQKFRIQVYEDGLIKQIYPLRSKQSEVAEYREISTKVVGNGAKFYIEIPRGKHEYKFEIVDNNRTVLLRFYIPRDDLINNR